MTLPNSVGLFTVKNFLAEKQTSKVKIPLFWGFLLPSDFPKSGGDPVYVVPTGYPVVVILYFRIIAN